MKKIYLLVFFIAFVFANSNAQFHCGYEVVNAYMKQHDPDYAHAMQMRIQQFEQLRAQGLLDQNQNPSRAVRTIPVVVHVVMPSNLQSAVSDANIQQMVNFMTQDFRLLNPNYASQTRTYFKQFAADAQIEFCLAKVDPNGNSTTGITRTNTTASCFSADSNPNDMKQSSTGGKAAWNQTKYLNIWIVDLCGSSTSGTAGYAYLPTTGMAGTNYRDGIVLDYQLGFGGGSRAASHEAGHYLGLEHAWGELSSNACGNVFPDTDDGFSDTPDSKAPNFYCQAITSCPNNSPSGDMIENIMDYASCPTMFTTQQANFMNLVLNGGPFASPFNTYGFASRASLVTNNNACQSSGSPMADFSASKTTICAGQQVTFTNASTGNATLTYTWNFQGGNPATSTATNPQVTYPAAGNYSVTLTATNGIGNDQEVKTGYITVLASKALPMSEGFESSTFPPTDWSINNPDLGITWARTTSASGYGQSSASAFFNCYSYSGAAGQRDWLLSPAYNFSTISSGRLKFDYAYAPYSANSKDSLQILYSTDCGSTWAQLWKKGGSSLNTTSGTSTSNFTPTSSQWKTDSVTLATGIAGQSSVRFAFVGVNNYGNNLYLDNINIYNAAPQTPQKPVADFVGSPTTVVVGNTVSFTDLSTNSPTSWSWTFAGGTPGTSTTQNPTITYNTVGQYNVTLTATNTAGSSTPVTKTVYITVVNQSQGGSGCDTLMNVPNDTTAGVYSYPFGTGYLSGNNSDGDLAKAERFVNNTTKTVSGAYFGLIGKSASPGTKTVTFAVWDNSGTGGSPGASPLATGTFPLSQLLNPNGTLAYVPFNTSPTVTSNFYVGVILPTTAGDTIALITTSNNAAYKDSLYGWEEYSDGTWGSYAAIYSQYNAGFSHWVYPVVCSQQATPIVAKFIASKTSICVGEQVTFTDKSTGNPTSWSWTFGLGTTPQASNVQNPTVTFNNAGNYTIKLTASNANGSDDSIMTNFITVNAKPTATTTVKSVSCFAGQDGSAKVVASGSSPFTYAWTGGGNKDSIVSKASGVYTVTVTDSKGCTTTANAQISQPVAALSATTTVTNAVCGLNNGSVTAAATGGNGNNTFQWNNGESDASIDSLLPGTYILTVTDSKGCIYETSAVVNNEPSTLSVTINTSASKCGQANGGAFATAITGGTTTISSYAWSNGGSSSSITNLAAGTYSVTVTNSLGCTASAIATVSDSSDLAVSITSKIQPSAIGTTDGSLTATATGSGTPITLEWSNGATTAVNSALGAGTYSVTATDANGCKAIAVDSLVNPAVSSIAGITNNTRVEVYPNPSSESIWVKISTTINEAGNISITNVLGQVVVAENLTQSEVLKQIEISKLTNGIYYLTYSSSNYRTTTIFVKK
ncbi:MAG: hypothetical protein BGO32_06430 [Bacteroidetes bacterium 37-13]|nr:MAG: hypothetical protein BGO32_06430 [Bacteroidetes bacterium 37-13]